MKESKNGFIAISIIYSFFILFITIMLLIMYSYISDRKISNTIKSDLINNLRNKAPDIIISQNGSKLPNPSYIVNVKILDGGNGIATAKYTWSESPNDTPTTDLPSYNEDLTIDTSTVSNGAYYLIVKACDINNNCKTVVTKSFSVGEPFLCIRATELHTEECKNDTENSYCLRAGYGTDDIISYGNLGYSSVNNVGDAYDCDINNDGLYNPADERFYYISDYYNTSTKKYDSTKATLIYYKNVKLGLPDNSSLSAYGENDGPSSTLNHLPSASNWSNIQSFINERNIESSLLDGPMEYDYTGEYETFVAPITGSYKFQLWGASGGYSLCDGNKCGTPGKGGYAEGTISLTKGDTLYVYVGQKGINGEYQVNSPATFNGGGAATWDNNDNESAGSGGGATDIRLVSGDWNDETSLQSRIMVAGGGGGSSWSRTAGSGGGINGLDNGNGGSLGATQTTGYQFGVGKDGSGTGDGDGVAGGGGGYWGGVSSSSASGEAGSGGSGYISGHLGCVAVEEGTSNPKSGCDDGTTNVSCSIHSSLIEFNNTVLLAGNTLIPTYDNNEYMTGNTGNGHVRIELLTVDSTTPTNFNFTYTSRAARLPSFYELNKCFSTKKTSKENDTVIYDIVTKKACEFLYENTKFSNSSNKEGYWLENPLTGNTDYIWTVSSNKNEIRGGAIKTNSTDYGVRPVIEVNKSQMEI